jgi:hypothetical protein
LEIEAERTSQISQQVRRGKAATAIDVNSRQRQTYQITSILMGFNPVNGPTERAPFSVGRRGFFQPFVQRLTRDPQHHGGHRLGAAGPAQGLVDQ